MGLYSQGNAFSRKVVNRKVLALILNFSTVGHGGGAFGLYWPMNPKDLPQFFPVKAALNTNCYKINMSFIANMYASKFFKVALQ